MVQERVVCISIITGVVGGVETNLQFGFLLENAHAVEKIQLPGKQRNLYGLFVGILQVSVECDTETFVTEGGQYMKLDDIGV